MYLWPITKLFLEYRYPLVILYGGYDFSQFLTEVGKLTDILFP